MQTANWKAYETSRLYFNIFDYKSKRIRKQMEAAKDQLKVGDSFIVAFLHYNHKLPGIKVDTPKYRRNQNKLNQHKQALLSWKQQVLGMVEKIEKNCEKEVSLV